MEDSGQEALFERGIGRSFCDVAIHFINPGRIVVRKRF